MTGEQIVLNDGEKEVPMTLLATFRLNDQDYCLMEDVDDGSSFFLRYFTDKDEVVFASLESEEELDEVMEAYEDLMIEKEQERKDQV